MIGAFQKNAFQNNAFQVDGVSTRGGVGGTYWKPEKDYEWPDLPGDVLASVHAAVRELASDPPENGEPKVPTVVEVVRAVQPKAFAMPPDIDMADLAQKISAAAAMAIQQWRDMEEADDEEALLALLH